jgi:hypothetical protein
MIRHSVLAFLIDMFAGAVQLHAHQPTVPHAYPAELQQKLDKAERPTANKGEFPGYLAKRFRVSLPGGAKVEDFFTQVGFRAARWDTVIWEYYATIALTPDQLSAFCKAWRDGPKPKGQSRIYEEDQSLPTIGGLPLPAQTPVQVEAWMKAASPWDFCYLDEGQTGAVIMRVSKKTNHIHLWAYELAKEKQAEANYFKVKIRGTLRVTGEPPKTGAPELDKQPFSTTIHGNSLTLHLFFGGDEKLLGTARKLDGKTIVLSGEMRRFIGGTISGLDERQPPLVYYVKVTTLQAVEAQGAELKEALVGKWVSDDDKIPVEFGADGSFRLALYKSGSAEWKWQIAEGTYVASDDGRVKYQAKLDGLAVKGHFTMKDGALIHPTGANYQTRWKKLPKGSDSLVAPERDPEEAFRKACALVAALEGTHDMLKGVSTVKPAIERDEHKKLKSAQLVFEKNAVPPGKNAAKAKDESKPFVYVSVELWCGRTQSPPASLYEIQWKGQTYQMWVRVYGSDADLVKLVRKLVEERLREPLPAKAASPEKWPGARSSLQALAPETATVVVAVARHKAEIHGRRAAHLSTQTTVGKGEVIEGGGYVFYAQCRQKFQVLEILRGQGKPGDRVLEYSFLEKTEGFPLPPVQEPIPAGEKLILLLGKKGNFLKALLDTEENRKAVLTLSEPKKKEAEPPQLTFRLETSQSLKAYRMGQPLVFEGVALVPIHRPGPEHFKITRVTDTEGVRLEVAYDRDQVEKLRPNQLRRVTPMKAVLRYGSLFKGTRLFLYNGMFSAKDPMGQAGILDLYGCPELEPGVRYRATWACWPVGAKQAVEVSCEFEFTK